MTEHVPITRPDLPRTELIAAPPDGTAVTRAQAVALVADQLARGVPPHVIEDSVLATPALRAHSEALVALCSALAAGTQAPPGADPDATVLAHVWARADLERRPAAVRVLLRHALVRSAIGVPAAPGALPYVVGGLAGLFAVPIAVSLLDRTAWAAAESILSVFTESVRRGYPVLCGISMFCVLLSLAFADNRLLARFRRALTFLAAVIVRPDLARLDAEAALLAFCEGDVPADHLPVPLRRHLPASRLWMLSKETSVPAESTRMLGEIEYSRALARLEGMATFHRIVVDLVQGGLVSALVILVLAPLLPLP